MESAGGDDQQPKRNLNRSSSLTLNKAMAADPPLQRSHSSNRTLMDIIHDESSSEKKSSWKSKLRLSRNNSGSNWTSTVPVPTSDVNINANTSSNRMEANNNIQSPSRFGDSPEPSLERGSGRFEHTSSLAIRRLRREKEDDDDDETAIRRLQREQNHDEDEDEDEQEEEDNDNAGGAEEEPVKMSLMSLLAETDREMGLDESTYMMEDEDEDEEEEEEESVASEYNNCCVCMVRHKGAAFIPCGHTFCRLCSRELFAQRGSCPLCNNYILEILDIF